MRITPDILLKLANDTVARQARADRTLTAAYLQGSLLKEQPLLGNTTDIDLFYIHNDEVSQEREIIRLTDDVHLDISHHSHKLYRQPRQLRQHPWMGPGVYGCRILYDPQHFMDFVQASVRGQFHRPDNVLDRSRQQAEHARQIWLDLHMQERLPGPAEATNYLRALEHAANAVAILTGAPLVERRFLLEFPARAEAVRHPGLYAGLVGLLGGPACDAQVLQAWLPDWRAAYTALTPEQAPVRLHPHRLPYYERALEAITASEHPQDALWPLWRTWTHAIARLAEDSPAFPAWLAAGQRLGLLGEAFAERVTALDAYLDLVEETLDIWGRENGA